MIRDQYYDCIKIDDDLKGNCKAFVLTETAGKNSLNCSTCKDFVLASEGPWVRENNPTANEFINQQWVANSCNYDIRNLLSLSYK